MRAHQQENADSTQKNGDEAHAKSNGSISGGASSLEVFRRAEHRGERRS
jgi:hypothetical protein